MKGATMTALGMTPSFGRPAVSEDVPFVESLFRTLNYRSDHPMRRFGSAKHPERGTLCASWAVNDRGERELTVIEIGISGVQVDLPIAEISSADVPCDR